MTNRTHRISGLRWLVAAGVVVILLAAGLALDLRNHGAAWRFFFEQTGEEAPVGQLRGMVEWLGSGLRAQPNTQPLVPIAYEPANRFGINTFLDQEVELVKREQQVRMIAEAGFGWIRQEFPWEDIEISGRGDFIDRRHVDLMGEVSAWDKYDTIVAYAEQYGVQIQARLSNPPTWAQAENESNFAPPADYQDFVNYAVAVAERYRGRILYYQIWNEPNIYPEWGEANPNPEAYTDLLCRTYAALKAVDPNIVVISGALAPTSELSDRNVNDFIFLERMYAAGAGDCFDILSMQGYGLNSGPTDRRMRPTTVNFSRNLYIRDLMVTHGDESKPIWISEAAWNPVDEPDVPRDIEGYGNYGISNLEQAARFMPLAYERANREWPWVGVVNYWFFKRASDSERGQAFYYFRMVEPDFTPLPVYNTMRDYIANQDEILYLGIHQETDPAFHYTDPPELVTDPEAELHSAAHLMEGPTSLTFTAHGTDISLRLKTGRQHLVRVAVDGRQIGEFTTDETWETFAVHHSLTAETHTVTLEVTSMRGALGEAWFDSALVADRTSLQVMPIAAAGIGLVLVTLGVLIAALRERGRRA